MHFVKANLVVKMFFAIFGCSESGLQTVSIRGRPFVSPPSARVGANSRNESTVSERKERKDGKSQPKLFFAAFHVFFAVK